MAKLTRSHVVGYHRPAPLTEDYTVDVLGGEVTITGIGTIEQYDAIQLDIQETRRSAEKLRGLLGYVPSPINIVHAAWVSACVVDPKLTTFEWLKTHRQAFGALNAIFGRALICSRMEQEIDADGNVTIPDGLAAASEALNNEEPGDPLKTPGEPSA